MKKKEIILIASLALFVLLVSNGALNAEIGIKGGLTFSKIVVSGQGATSDMNYLRRLNIGIFSNFRFTENLSILTELYYSQKGFNQTRTLGEDENVIDLKLDYIEVPLLVKFLVSDRGLIHPYLLGGGYGAYTLRAKNHAYTKGSKTEIVTDMGEFFKTLDWGIIGGAGVEYQWSDFLKFNLEIRYSMGLPDIYNETGTTGIKFKNRTLNVIIGLSF